VEQHVLVRPQLSAGDQHVPGGQEDERDRGGLGVGETGRDREDVAARHDEELRGAAVAMLSEQSEARTEPVLPGEAAHAVAAGDAGADDHRIARGDVLDPGADRVDDACDLGPRHERQREAVPGDAATHPEVEMVEPDRDDPHPHLAGARDRIRELLPLEDLRSSVALDAVSVHGPSLPPR